MTTYHIESFDGTGNATEFIRDFETLSSTWTGEERCMKFSQYLKGPAVPWMEFVRGGGALSEKLVGSFSRDTWADLRKAFIEEFHRNYGIEWYTCSQGPDELGSSFLFRMLNLYNSHEELSYKNSSLTEIIISKLNNKYRAKVKLQRPGKLDELKDILKLIDHEQQEKNAGSTSCTKEPVSKIASKNKLSRRLCYKCRKRGHIARNCKVVKQKKRKMIEKKYER
jgi:hypothetical protein